MWVPMWAKHLRSNNNRSSNRVVNNNKGVAHRAQTTMAATTFTVGYKILSKETETHGQAQPLNITLLVHSNMPMHILMQMLGTTGTRRLHNHTGLVGIERAVLQDTQVQGNTHSTPTVLVHRPPRTSARLFLAPTTAQEFHLLMPMNIKMQMTLVSHTDRTLGVQTAATASHLAMTSGKYVRAAGGMAASTACTSCT